MNVFLIDGTHELFRYFYAVPAAHDADGRDIGAVRGVLGSVVSMLAHDVTHVGVATDHVIESFRNVLWPGYKTGEGIAPALRAQFLPLEHALRVLGIVVWPMTEFEADDGLASAAAKAAADPEVEQSGEGGRQVEDQFASTLIDEPRDIVLERPEPFHDERSAQIENRHVADHAFVNGHLERHRLVCKSRAVGRAAMSPRDARYRISAMR